MERLGWDPKRVEKTDRRVLWDLQGANPSEVEQWIRGALSSAEAKEGVTLKARLFGRTVRVALANSSVPRSSNPVVANALAWKAKNAKDSDGKELKVGDKIKVQVDMNGRWDGGGVVTALKPYRVVEYKDVFGRINTTQETSVRKA